MAVPTYLRYNTDNQTPLDELRPTPNSLNYSGGKPNSDGISSILGNMAMFAVADAGIRVAAKTLNKLPGALGAIGKSIGFVARFAEKFQGEKTLSGMFKATQLSKTLRANEYYKSLKSSKLAYSEWSKTYQLGKTKLQETEKGLDYLESLRATRRIRELNSIRRTGSEGRNIFRGAMLSGANKMFAGTASFYGADQLLKITDKSKETNPIPFYNIPGHLWNYTKFSVGFAPFNFIIKGGLGIGSHTLDFAKRGVLEGSKALSGSITPKLINTITKHVDDGIVYGKEVITPTWNALKNRRVTRTTIDDYRNIIDQGLEKYKIHKEQARRSVINTKDYTSNARATIKLAMASGVKDPAQAIRAVSGIPSTGDNFWLAAMDLLGFKRKNFSKSSDLDQLIKYAKEDGASLDPIKLKRLKTKGGRPIAAVRSLRYDPGLLEGPGGVTTAFLYPMKEKLFKPLASLEFKILGNWRISDFFGRSAFLTQGLNYQRLPKESEWYLGTGRPKTSNQAELAFINKKINTEGILHVDSNRYYFVNGKIVTVDAPGKVRDLTPEGVGFKLTHKSRGITDEDIVYGQESRAFRLQRNKGDTFLKKVTDFADYKSSGFLKVAFGKSGYIRKFFNAKSPTQIYNLYNPNTPIGGTIGNVQQSIKDGKFDVIIDALKSGSQIKINSGGMKDILDIVQTTVSGGQELGSYNTRDFLIKLLQNASPERYEKQMNRKVFSDSVRLMKTLKTYMGGLKSKDTNTQELVSTIVNKYRLNEYVNKPIDEIIGRPPVRKGMGLLGSRGHTAEDEIMEALTVSELFTTGNLPQAVDTTIKQLVAAGKINEKDRLAIKMWQFDKELLNWKRGGTKSGITGEIESLPVDKVEALKSLLDIHKKDLLSSADKLYRLRTDVSAEMNNIMGPTRIEELSKSIKDKTSVQLIEEKMRHFSNKPYQLHITRGKLISNEGTKLNKYMFGGYLAAVKAEKAAEFIGAGIGHPYASKPGLNYIGNILLKRGIPLMAAWGALNTIDDLAFDVNPMFNNTALDEGATVFAAEAGVKQRIGMAHLYDMTGITNVMKYAEGLMPGSVNSPFAQMARGFAFALAPKAMMKSFFKGGVTSEIQGFAALGGLALSGLSTGFGFWDLTKSAAELKDEYSGRVEVPYRKARFWETGGTPWQGSRIQFYKPNWFATLKGQAMDSEEQLGSPVEQFLYKPWLGIDFNPLGYVLSGGPLGSGHYTSRKYYSRPYPISGEPFNEVPVIGPALSSTLGRLISPPKRMHTEEMNAALGEWGYYTKGYTSKYQDEGYNPRLTPPKSPYSLTQAFGNMVYNAEEFAGLRGFGAQSMSKWMLGFQQPFESEDIMQSSSEITSARRTYWDKNIGGMLGSCWVKGTKIVTDNGRIPIEDIKVGDMVISSDGKLYPVANTLKRKANDLYKIKTNVLDIELIGTGKHHIPIFRPDICVDGHTKPCRPGSKKRCIKFPICKTRKIELVNTNLKDIKKGDYVVTPIIPLKNKYPIINGIEIDKNLAYVLGWLIAEGHTSKVTNRITFTMHKNELLYANKIEEIVKNKFNIESHITINGNCLILRFSSREFKKITEIFGFGAKNKQIPYSIKSMPEDALLEFFKGMMLGDGHCNENISGYHCANENLVRDLVDIGLSLGFKSYIVTNYFVKGKGTMPQGTPRKDSISSYLYWDGPSVAKIYNLLYDKNINIPIEHRRFSFIYDNKYFIKVESVEEIKSDDVDVYDFEVENKHHYVAQQIIVHNTEWIRRLIPRKRKKLWEFNPIPNRMPSWLPKEFRIGDAFTKIEYGELLLPGSAYEASHDIHRTFPVNASELGMTIPDTVKKLLTLGPQEPIGPDDLTRQNNEISAAATIYNAEHNISGTFDEVIRMGRKNMLGKIKNLSDREMQNFIGPSTKDMSELNFLLKEKGMDEGLLSYYYQGIPVTTLPIKFDLNKYEKDIAVLEKARQIASGALNKRKKLGFVGESYSNLDRLKILSNVAPYSGEYKRELAIVRKQISAGQVNREDLDRVLKQRENIMRKYELYPYRFKDQVLSPSSEANIQSSNEYIKAASEYNVVARSIGSVWERFCLVNNQLIFTDNGYKKAEDIKINDRLLNKTGKFVSVKNISKRKKKDVEKVINIELCKTRIYNLKLTEDHELLVCNIQNKHKHWKRKYNNEPLEWKKAKNITTDDFIVYPKNVPNNEFDNDLMRLYGYYLAEGSIQFSRGVPSGIHFSFHTKEKNYHTDIKNIVKKIYNKDVIIRNEKHNSTTVSFFNKEIATFFIDNFGRGSGNKKIPSWIFTASKDNIKNIISGYVRGDGHLFNKGYNMCSISRTLIDGMKQLFINIGIYPACYFKKQKIGNDGVVRKDAYVLSICGDDVNKFNPFIEEIKIKRSRSCSSYTFEKDDCILVKVRTCNIVEYIGEVYDFETDGSYLTSCGIVHNSHMDTPLHSKFLQYRSPLESYQRSMLYGRDIKMWSNPISHWARAYQTGFTSKTTLTEGAIAGGIGGTVFLTPGIGTVIGAAIGGMWGSVHGVYRDITGTTYIPNTVETGRRTHKFFDNIQYEKSMMLYNMTGNEKYMEMANSTMAGINPSDLSKPGWSRMAAAIPYPERPYIMPFLEETNKSERENILKYVPDEVANLINTKWSILDKNYAAQRKHNSKQEQFKMPKKNWVGWHEDVNLNDYELKTLEHKGLDSHDWGLGWYEQERRMRNSFAPIEPLNVRSKMDNIKQAENNAQLETDDIRIMIERLIKDTGGSATVIVYKDSYSPTNRVNITLH